MSAHDGAEPAPAAADDRRRRLAALLGDDGSDVAAAVVASDDPVGSPRDDRVPRSPPSSRSAPGLSGLRGRLERLCVTTVSEVAVDGAGITVMGSADAGRAGYRDQVAATGGLSRCLEDLQLTAGEGPCLDAYTSGAPVLAPDLVIETTRWLGFAAEAITSGAAAVFSLPLQVGAVRLGTLDLNRGTAGGLSRAQLADALTLAALATETLLEIAADPGVGADREPWPDAGWLPDVHADVHVAAGMVSARTGFDVGAALVRIRAHAFASGEPIHDVARRIIDRDLVLGDPGPDETDTDHQGPSAPEDDH